MSLHYDGLVAHGRHVGAAGGTHSHHDGDLRDAHCRHSSLVVEETAEMLLIWEHSILLWQEGAAAVDHIHARQMVFHRYLLCAQVFLDGVLHIRAAFHRGVVGNDNSLTALDHADTGDDARRREVVVIRVVCRHRRELQKRSVLVDEQVDALAGKEFVAFLMLGDSRLAAAVHAGVHGVVILRHQLHESLAVLLKLSACRRYLRF